MKRHLLPALAVLVATCAAGHADPTVNLEFNGSGNNLAATGFESVWNENDNGLNVTGGSLILKTLPGDTYGQYGDPCDTPGGQDPDNAQNVLYSTIDALDKTTVDTKVVVSNENTNFHGGGIWIGTDTDHYFRLGVANNTFAGGIVVEGLRENEDLWPGPHPNDPNYPDNCPNGPGGDIHGETAMIAASPLTAPLTVYLRIVRTGSNATAFYSLNGSTYTQLNNYTFDSIATSQLSGLTVEDDSFKVGAYALGGPDDTSKQASIAFDYIHASSVALSEQLITANGYNWKLHQGTDPAWKDPAFDDSSWNDRPVPDPDWGTLDNPITPKTLNYGTYRVHFTTPASLQGFTNRTLLLQITVFNGAAVGDVDETYLNGTTIGATGNFPDYNLPGPDTGANGQANFFPGLRIANGAERDYYFPGSLLRSGANANVLVIKAYNRGGGGGLNGFPILTVAPPSVSITGKITAGGTGVAGVRVGGVDANGNTSEGTLTDASGNFSLPIVFAGTVTIGAAKPGYNAASVALGTLAEGATKTVNIDLAPVANADIAPYYDNFDDGPNGWRSRWDALSLSNPSSSDAAPTIVEPGYDVKVGPSSILPSTITVQNTASLGALLSKSRFSKFASVNAARLVSANSGNIAVLNLEGQPQESNASLNPVSGSGAANDPYAELRLDGKGNLLDQSGNVIATRVRVRIFYNGLGFQLSQFPATFNLTDMANVTPSNPVDLTISRVGSYFDFFVDDGTTAPVRVFSQNVIFPATNPMANHKLALYGNNSGDTLTWDWAKASPIVVTSTQLSAVQTALKIAGGLQASTSADVAALNVAGGDDSRITLQDAVKLLRSASGL